METVPLPPEFGADRPSTAAFVAVCLLVALGGVVIYRGSSHSPRVWRSVAVGLGAWMLISYVLASSGALRELAGSMKLGAYVGGSNLAALVLALSPVSAAVASRASAWMLVAFQGFRLPLELNLHHWFEIGVMPIQITYEGANFDIVTGVAAVSVATVLLLLAGSARFETFSAPLGHIRVGRGAALPTVMNSRCDVVEAYQKSYIHNVAS